LPNQIKSDLSLLKKRPKAEGENSNVETTNINAQPRPAKKKETNGGFKITLPTMQQATNSATPDLPRDTTDRDSAAGVLAADPLKNALLNAAKSQEASLNANLSISELPIDIKTIGSIPVNEISANKGKADPDSYNLANYLYEGQKDDPDQRATAAFYEQLQILEKSFDTGFAKDNITTILNFIDSHDFLKSILKPDDVGIMTRGMRKAYTLAATVKIAATAKKSQKAAQVDDVVDLLTDMDF